jgi:hypothetical protein
LVSARMNGRSEVWTVMLAIDGGPGWAAFFVGERTWIPAFAGMTVERVCGGGRRGDRTGAACAIGRSWQVPAPRFSPRFHHHRAVMSGARAPRFSPRFHHHRAVMSGARALRFSPRFHHRRPVMSGATLAQVHPAPTTVIPAKAGIQVGFRENERAAGGVDVMSAIDRGPGYAAFFVGGRTWIPAFAGMTVERVCGGGRRGDRTGAPGAIGWSCQARALRFSPRFHHHRAVMSGAGPAVFAPLPPPSGGHVRRRPRGFRPDPATVGRSCQAPPSPRSTLPPPPSSPRRRG